MARYAVTFTRQVTQTATFIVDADDAGSAQVAAEDAPWSEATITSTHDNVGPEDGWRHAGASEITLAAGRIFRRRLAAAIGYGERQQPSRP